MFGLGAAIHSTVVLHPFTVLRRVVAIDTTRFNVLAHFPGLVPLIKDGWIGQQMATAAVKLRFRDFRLWQFDEDLHLLFGPQGRDGQDQARHHGQDEKLIDSIITAHGQIPLSSRGARSPLLRLYVDMQDNKNSTDEQRNFLPFVSSKDSFLKIQASPTKSLSLHTSKELLTQKISSSSSTGVPRQA
jgi:hypothetical protein